MENLTLVDHPILQTALTMLRRRETSHGQFRAEMVRASLILACETLRGLRTARVAIQTPLEAAEGVEIDEDVVVVPILRAGLSLVDGFLQLVPDAKVGHLGMYRNERTHEPVDYYGRLPRELGSALTILVDPMLATGGSAVRAIDSVRRAGATQISLVCVLAAHEGVRRMVTAHPDVRIFAAAMDRNLDDNAFIRPGLGDAGDRAFGTEE